MWIFSLIIWMSPAAFASRSTFQQRASLLKSTPISAQYCWFFTDIYERYKKYWKTDHLFLGCWLIDYGINKIWWSMHCPIRFSEKKKPSWACLLRFGLKLIFHQTLTILTGKTVFYSIQYMNGWLAASDLFDMFSQSIKFCYKFHYHVLRVQMIEQCDSSNRQ